MCISECIVKGKQQGEVVLNNFRVFYVIDLVTELFHIIASEFLIYLGLK